MGVTRYSVGSMGRLSSSGFYMSRKVVVFMVLLLGALLLAVGILGTFYVRCSHQTSPLSSKSGTVTRTTPANHPMAYKLQVGEEQKANIIRSPVTRPSTTQPSWSRDPSRLLTLGPRDPRSLSTSGSMDDPILSTAEPWTYSSLSTSKPWTHPNLFSSQPRGLFTSKPRDYRTQSTPQPQPQPQPTSEPWKHPRLPSDVVPSHYDLELWIYLRPENIKESSKFFNGRLNITVKCVSPTTRVLVHSLGLDYEDTAVLGPLSEDSWAHKEQRPVDRVAVNNTWKYPEMEYLVIELRETLKSGHHYMLQFDFSGSVNQTHEDGLFRTLYSDQKNTKAVIASQLEPTFARAIYPCFDEPAMKATFNVTIVHHPTFVALSNMPVIATSKREDVNGFIWTVTSFETTPLMSTYITAFAVCDYHYVKGMERGKEVRIWARKDAIAKGEADFSLSISGPMFSKLEDLLNVSYPLPKIDLIGFPTFTIQAMENWGLITFDDHLLVQTKDDFPERKIMILSTVAHEIAHQWFGNLVTMKWWNDAWLNEGFASYFEYYMIKEFNPQIFKFQNEFFYHSFMSFILRQDHAMIARTVSTKVVNYTKSSDINVLFDEYIYKKGGCIIRMFSNCLGEDLFIRGLQSYLKTFAFSNAEQDDLWNHFQMVLDNQNEVLLPASVKSIMDKWTHQSGCPIITLDVSTGKVNQQPFFLAKDKDQITPFHNNTWTVPINWMKSGVVQPLVWLDNNSKVFPEMQLSDSEHDWVILNVNTTGYYMTNYDQLGWKKICLMLEKDPKVISVSDRMKLFDDAFTLSWYGYIEIETALDLTKYLAKEEEALVWNKVFLNLLRPDLFVSLNHHNVYLLLKKYLLKKLTPMWHIYSNKIRENTVQDDEMTILSLKKVFEGACWLGLEDCLQLSREIFSKWMNHSEPIKDSNLIKYEIMCFGVAVGSDKEWDFLLSIYERSQLEEEEENLLHSMSCSKDPWVLYRSMEYALDENSVISEPSHMLNLIAETVIGRLVTKEFLINNWQAVEKRFGKESLISLASTIAAPISTDSELQEFQQFSRTILGENDSVMLLNIIKEQMKVNQQNNKSIAKIINWLKKNMDD